MKKNILCDENYQVFISYSSKNKKLVDFLCDQLETADIKCWIAPRDIKAGAYATSILRGIEKSKVFLLIFSQHSNKSEHVLREVDYALSHKLKIVPVNIDGTIPTDAMKYYLSTIHWLDVKDYQKPSNIKMILQAIHSSLEIDNSKKTYKTPPKLSLQKYKRPLSIIFFISFISISYLMSGYTRLFHSEFISDINFPDGSKVKPYENIQKSWRIKNIGFFDWENLEMQRIGTADGDGLIKSSSSFSIPYTKSKEQIDINVNLKMPSKSGSTIAYWKSKKKDSNSFLLDKQNPIFTKLTVVSENSFIEDINCPNGSIFNINTTFVKKWKIKNITNKTWEDVYLQRANGSISLKSKNKIRLPKIEPGDSTIIHMSLTTPSEPTTVTSYWKVVDKFGNDLVENDEIYLTIIVMYDVNKIFGYKYKRCDGEP
jgi:hypothetical protein